MKSVSKMLIVATAVLSASVAFASTDFAGPYCDSGCRRIDSISNSGDQIYFGNVAKTYRVCHADMGNLTVVVDSQKLEVPDGTVERRNCVDVTGTSIGIYGSAAWVGPVGQ